MKMEINEAWDFIKWILSGAVTGLSFIMVYLFNQIQSLKDKMSVNKEKIALNDAHDKNTDGILAELKEIIKDNHKDLSSKIDQLITK